MKFDKIFLSLSVVILLTTISWITSCTHKVDTTNMPTVCYQEINNIILNNCTKIKGCHDGTPGSESINMTGVPSVWINATVKAYNPDQSQFYTAIISVRGENKMPPDTPPIAEELRSTIRLWIEQGAKTVACPKDTAIVINGNDKMLNK